METGVCDSNLTCASKRRGPIAPTTGRSRFAGLRLVCLCCVRQNGAGCPTRPQYRSPVDLAPVKLAWFKRLIEHSAELIKAGVPVVLAGDYNVVPTVQDIYPTRSLDNNALIHPQSRQAYAQLLGQGWTDALRKLQPEGPLWTFWDYERSRWPLDTYVSLILHGASF
jgi:hypothetical protein